MKTALDYFKVMVVTMDYESMTPEEQETVNMFYSTKEEYIESIALQSYGHFQHRESFLLNYLSDSYDAVVEGHCSRESFVKFLNLLGDIDDELRGIADNRIKMIMNEELEDE